MISILYLSLSRGRHGYLGGDPRWPRKVPGDRVAPSGRGQQAPRGVLHLCGPQQARLRQTDREDKDPREK